MKRTSCFGLSFILGCLLLGGFPKGAFSDQTDQDTTKSQTRGRYGVQYYYGTEQIQESQLLMKINVWGRVNKPGEYIVPSTTDLVTMISRAGGPAGRSRIDNIKIVRSNSIGGEEVITVNLAKFLKTGRADLIPILQPGDTVIISGSIFYFVSDMLGFLAQVGSFATIYYYFVIATR